MKGSNASRYTVHFMAASITASIVSHGQAELVATLLSDLQDHCPGLSKVVVTLNVEEPLPFDAGRCPFSVEIVKNGIPKGFAANHNEAFKLAQTDYFCVLNPDVRLTGDPFPPLLAQLKDSTVGVAAPLIKSPDGSIEDSARRFPTPARILKRSLFGARGLEYEIGSAPLFPDWIAGMFMLFRSAVFGAAGGFDERYFLYCEDVDICWCMRRSGLRAVLVPEVSVIHDARRRSHRDLRYLAWHVTSMLRFFGRRAFGKSNHRS